MRHGAEPRGPGAGFTLVELLLALFLLSMLVLALVRLLDTSLNIWGRTETGRDLLEMGSSVVDLLAEDLSALESGARGDFLAEWAAFDTDRDGVQGALYPRLRLVRQVSAAELARLDPGGVRDPRALGLIEVCWALLPAGATERDLRPLGVLWRGERDVNGRETLSFLASEFFGRNGQPVAGALNEVTGGILWCDLWFATQTSVLEDGWKVGERLADCALSWDAWGRRRPDESVSPRNRPGTGMPAADDAPLLPRRVRIELEIERTSDLKRRTRLSSRMDPESKELFVENERHVPDAGELVLVDEEWMKILSKSGTRVAVERGQRDSQPTKHEGGALLHHGWRIVRDIPVALYREDWNL